MEKIDIVKRLIRSNNYQQIERVYLRCIELGIHVNRTALSRFAQKLELIDRAERQAKRKKNLSEFGFEPQTKTVYSNKQNADMALSAEPKTTNQTEHPAPQPVVAHQPPVVHSSQAQTTTTTLPPSTATDSPLLAISQESVSSLPVSSQENTKKTISYGEAKRRETEITFELGALKIKEHALLEELNELAQIIEDKH